METTYYSLASKNNFNKALRHFFSVNEVVDEVESDRNLADVVNKWLTSGDITADQVLPIVGSVIRDKFGYAYDSYNIPATIVDFSKIAAESIKWTALDLVIVYYSPIGQIILINPKNINHWNNARELNKDQLVVVYAKFLKGENKKVEKEAVTAIEEMIAGKDVFINQEFIDQTKVQRVQPVQQPQRPPQTQGQPQGQTSAGDAKKSITPKYPVQVSNELFHNGNVEAWKKIIESFKAKYPDQEVSIYHQNALINDINALFKWGKVKHADSIFFQVAGENIQGVSKLKKYLYEGASPRYEQFLKVGLGQILNLF